MTIFEIEELDVAHVTDEQAAAIGRLALSFNFLESCIDEAISFIISPPDAPGIGVLTARLGFDAKVSRLEAIVKHFRHSLTMPDATEATADQIHTWAAESIGQLPVLLKRLRDAYDGSHQSPVPERYRPHCCSRRRGSMIELRPRVQAPAPALPNCAPFQWA